jgi:hypothetical protein
VRAKPARVERAIRAAQKRRGCERVQQVVVARTRLVRAGQDRIDDAQRRVRADALVRDAVAREHRTEARCRMLECAHDRRANRHRAPTLATRAAQRFLRRNRNSIRLSERQ